MTKEQYFEEIESIKNSDNNEFIKDKLINELDLKFLNFNFKINKGDIINYDNNFYQICNLTITYDIYNVPYYIYTGVLLNDLKMKPSNKKSYVYKSFSSTNNKIN